MKQGIRCERWRVTLATLLLALLASVLAGCATHSTDSFFPSDPGTEDTDAIESEPVGEIVAVLRPGIRYADALASLKRAGAEPFWCGYMLEIEGPYSWFTLPSGLSVELCGDKGALDRPALVTTLAVCNSSMLFCCKGETWYQVDSVSLVTNSFVVDHPLARGSNWKDDALRSVEHYVYKGMYFSNVTNALVAAGATALPVTEAWLAQMPRTGEWHRYRLNKHPDLELILNFGFETSPPDQTLRLMLIEATKPKDQHSDSARYKVECELVDLADPLEKNWHWAFHDVLAWKPGDRARTDRMKALGLKR
jgi:hypothetical protein